MKKKTQVNLHGFLMQDISSINFLILLISADMVFLILHFFWGPAYLNNILFSLSTDLGYSEFYQYIKEFWIVILLLLIFLYTKQAGFIAWSFLFLYLLFDDSIGIHEQLGSIIAEKLQTMGVVPLWGIRLQDYGELFVSLTIGGSLLLAILFFYFWGSATFRRVTRDLVLFLALLFFFGVVLDIVQYAFTSRRGFGFLEDGGEMIIMSIIVYYTYVLAYNKGTVRTTMFEVILNTIQGFTKHQTGKEE